MKLDHLQRLIRLMSQQITAAEEWVKFNRDSLTHYRLGRGQKHPSCVGLIAFHSKELKKAREKLQKLVAMQRSFKDEAGFNVNNARFQKRQSERLVRLQVTR